MRVEETDALQVAVVVVFVAGFPDDGCFEREGVEDAVGGGDFLEESEGVHGASLPMKNRKR